MVIITFKLDGQEFPPPVKWEDIHLLSEFINDSVEAKSDIDVLRFTGPLATAVRNHRLAGMNGGPGIFEGPTIEINVRDTTKPGQDVNIVGYVNMSDSSYIERTPTDISAKIGRLDLLSDLQNKLEGVTFALLCSLDNSDFRRVSLYDYTTVKYVVEPDFSWSEFLALLITAFLIVKEIISLIKDIVKDIGIIAGLISGITTSAGAVVFAILSLALNIAYAIILFKVLIDLLGDIMSYIYPIAKKIKGMTLATALRKVFQYAGYDYLNVVPEFEQTVLIPSKPQNTGKLGSKLLSSGHHTGNTSTGGGAGFPILNTTTPTTGPAAVLPVDKQHADWIGIPNPGDYGYRAIELVDLAKLLVKGKLRINRQATSPTGPLGRVELYPLVDPYWQNQTSLVLKDVLNEVKVFNTTELSSTRLYAYSFDSSDPWTIEESKGRSYEVNTSPVNITKRENMSLKGYEETRFPVALGIRKDNLTEVEEAAAVLAGVLDDAIDFFNKACNAILNFAQTIGGNTSQNLQHPPSNIQDKVLQRRSYLKIWYKYFNIPKLVYISEKPTNYLVDYVMPADYKDHISPRALWNKYLKHSSFVLDNFAGQKLIFTDQRVPMTFADWLIASVNCFCKMADGRDVQLTNIKLTPSADYALISGYIPEVYTKNLKETYIEAE